jgi:Tfp pilus assembly protein PilX
MQTVINRLKDESGAAIASALMVLVLLAGVTAGVTALVITDTRVRALDGTRTQAFYAAHAALEQLTADLGDLFAKDYANR